MSRILFTMVSSNDLGLPSRLIPVARALAERGHDVAIVNTAPGPKALIAESGLQQFPLSKIDLPPRSIDLLAASRAFDVEHLLGLLYSDVPYFRALTTQYLDAFRSFRPDIVVDSFGPFACLAARILHIPLVQITQGNFLADSPGFLWWEEMRPPHLPSALDALNSVAAEHGLTPMTGAADIMNGDLTFVVGSPQTDPVGDSLPVRHVGTLQAGHVDSKLPDWIETRELGRKLIWIYSGNPRYAGTRGSTHMDSAIVLDAALGSLGDIDADVILTTGFQDMPDGRICPPNIRFADFVSGPAMAARCDMMIHHGGHGSMITGLAAGKPAVIVPTNSERESNARRLALLGAGECVLPIDASQLDKNVDQRAFASAVQRVLTKPSYAAAARQIGGAVRQLGGVAEIVRHVEALAMTG